MRISASLASAPFTELAETVMSLERSGIDAIHFDIEDGQFMPMMTLGTRVIEQLRPLTSLPFHIHLGVSNPERWIQTASSLGADLISIHAEACPYPHRSLALIRDLGRKAGLAFNPATPLCDLRYLNSVLDLVLILTTEPEYPDAPFLPEVLAKIPPGRLSVDNPELEWYVDGGITSRNARHAAGSGATGLVVGRAVFSGGAIGDNVAALRASCAQSGEVSMGRLSPDSEAMLTSYDLT